MILSSTTSCSVENMMIARNCFRTLTPQVDWTRKQRPPLRSVKFLLALVIQTRWRSSGRKLTSLTLLQHTNSQQFRRMAYFLCINKLFISLSSSRYSLPVATSLQSCLARYNLYIFPILCLTSRRGIWAK